MSTASGKSPSRPVLSLFMLTMINVATIGSIKNWPVTAEYGFSSVFFFILATIIFFIPTALVSAELATGWPELGGVFAWVKEAFGHRVGFLAAWLLWAQNIVWYPTALSFIAATISYIFNPALASNDWYTFSVVVLLFWIITWLNLKGMRISGWISSGGMILGTFLPGIFIIILGAIWFFSGFPLQITVSKNTFIPALNSLPQLALFTGILISLAGIEMSAVHAKEVIAPRKNYPKAILYGVLIILALSIPGVLAIAMVVPQSEISLLAGSVQAISVFLSAYDLKAMTAPLAFLVAIGTTASVSTWTAGPTKAVLAAAQEGDLPPLFSKVNRHQMPSALLLLQASVVTLLSLLFVFIPSLNQAFWILLVMVSELYLIMYLLMFAAALRLRYIKEQTERGYKIPGGKVGIWVVSVVGILSCLLAMWIGFIPPSHLSSTSSSSSQTTSFFLDTTLGYSFLIGIGVLLFALAPFVISLFRKPHWQKPPG